MTSKDSKPAAKPRSKKPPADKKDSMGFTKKDYPWIGIVAVLAVNAMAFNSGNGLYITGIILADLLGGYWVYKRYLAKYMPTKKAQPQEETGEATKQATEVDERGIFNVRKKHYPLLIVGAVVICNAVAFMQMSVPLIVAVVIVDVLAGWLGYKRFKSRRTNKSGKI